VNWCRKASNLRPQDANYSYTFAFYLNQNGDKNEAMTYLNAILEKNPRHKDAESLLKEISR
jgi:thioredoxin-like negative regulator of GroEL